MTNRWRTLCAECQALVAHPLETLPLTPVTVVWVAGRMWLDNAYWIIPYSLLVAVPFVAMRWVLPPDEWKVSMALALLIGSLTEILFLRWLAMRTYSWVKPPLMLQRFGVVLVVNLVSTVLATIGMLGCFVGMLFVSNFLMLVVPLALFDRRGVFGSIGDSFRLSYRHYWLLLPATLLYGAPTLILSLVEQVAPAVRVTFPRLTAPLEAFRIFAPLLERQLHSLMQLLELVFWGFLVARPKSGEVNPRISETPPAPLTEPPGSPLA